jgi:hypothetical protein
MESVWEEMDVSGENEGGAMLLFPVTIDVVWLRDTRRLGCAIRHARRETFWWSLTAKSSMVRVAH